MLSRETIAERALIIVDEVGPGGLSMRELARRLDVTAMALYNHVEDKQAVLDAVAERVLSEIDPPEPGSPWQERVASIFTQLRAASLRHPNAILLVQTATHVSVPMLTPMESALQALNDAGLAPVAALAAWAGLVGLTNGHAAYQINGHLRTGPETARIDPERFPAIALAMSSGALDWDRSFDHALKAQIARLEAEVPTDGTKPGLGKSAGEDKGAGHHER